jgi:hypothetical protein
MQEQPIPDAAERWDTIERDALYLLTGSDDHQPLWSVEDLGRELELPKDGMHAIDVVRGLQRAGLIHHTSDGHVFATRPAVRLVQIVGQVV